VLKTIVSSILAIFLALFFNSYLGKKADSLLIPLIEETFKNGLAYLFNVSPLPVHLIFGLAEGIWESFTNSKWLLLGNALLGHGVYGAVALILWSKPYLAFTVAFLLHALYNTYILKITGGAK